MQLQDYARLSQPSLSRESLETGKLEVAGLGEMR